MRHDGRVAVHDTQAPEDAAFAEFHEFVVRHDGRLERACSEITGNDDVAAAIRVEMLVDVASRWRRWPAGSRTAKALIRLEKLLRREARRHGGIAHPAALHLSASTEYGPPSTVDGLATAGIAWRRAAGLRRQRWAGAAVVILVAVAALGFSLRPDPAPAPVPIPLPTTTEDGVTVLPRFADLGQLPAGLPGPLPATLALEPDATDAVPPLSDILLNRAVLVARAHDGQLVLLGPGGTPRRFADPRLPGARLLPTSLSPSGERVALAVGNDLLVVDIPAATGQLLPAQAQQPDPPVITWLNDDTVLVPRDAGARVVDVVSGASFDISEPAEDVASVRADPSMPFVKLIGGGAGPDEALIETWYATLSPSEQQFPPASMVGLGGSDERVAVPGPPWMRSWSGPGWWSPNLSARGCDPPAVELPTGLGPARGAVTAAWVRGHIGTLVSLDSELVALGFRHQLQVLVTVRGAGQTQLLGWNPFEQSSNPIYRLTTLSADTDVTVADLSRW
jgi:hypothetical protein